MGEPRLPVFGQEKQRRLPDDLTGMRFGLLVVQSRILPNQPGGSRWLCKCDCGETCKVKRRSLVEGRQSCGCLVRFMLGKVKRKI
jgi:hypothetical protein